MPRCICKLKNSYFEWSTICDSIVSKPMSLRKFKKYYIKMYGARPSAIIDLKESLERVEETGTSFHGYSIDNLIEHNRAGENEECLSIQEIIEKYKIK